MNFRDRAAGTTAMVVFDVLFKDLQLRQEEILKIINEKGTKIFKDGFEITLIKDWIVGIQNIPVPPITEIPDYGIVGRLT